MSETEDRFSGYAALTQADHAVEETQSDSLYSASETSRSSSTAKGALKSRGRAQKRKMTQEEDSTTLRGRVKRLKGSYNDTYRELFNETLNDVLPSKAPEGDIVSSSQIGVTIWSPEEKDRLFHSLTRRGRLDLRSIAADINSKSESEVHVYLEKLQKATVDEQRYEIPRKLQKSSDIDAAVEISPACCASLDCAAEALSVLQHREEERSENSKHGEFSLLTPTLAKWVERRLRTGKEGEDEISKMLPAARLLNLRAFLTLSKRLFMNSSVVENNWRTYTERRKSPSMMYTAFSDLHKLSICITERLIQSSLLFAMSRLRAMDASGHYISGRYVKRQDVLAALDVLGMEHNSTNVWAMAARRCRLRVYEKVRNRQVRGKRFGYDEIESVLGHGGSDDRGRLAASSPDVPNFSDAEDGETSRLSSPVLSEGSSPSNHSHDGGFGALPSEEHSPIGDDNKQARRQELLEQAQDSYTEALDQRASREEEKRLWELLGEKVTDKMELKSVGLPKAPVTGRRTGEDLVDWKTLVDYAGEWETHETLIALGSFVESQRRAGNHDQVMESMVSAIESANGSDRSPIQKVLSDDFIYNESSSRGQSLETEDDTCSDTHGDDDASLSASEAAGRATNPQLEQSDNVTRSGGEPAPDEEEGERV